MVDITIDNSLLSYFKPSEIDKILTIGESLLGIPKDELGEDYVIELDRVINGLDDFLQKDIHTLIWLFCSRLSGLILGRSLQPFTKMSDDNRINYLNRWMKSRIPLARTIYVTLRALTSWSYYTSERAEKEIDFPGKTIGKEHELPTLLYGKEAYDPKEYLEEEFQ